MPKTTTILVSTQNERTTAIARMEDAGWTFKGAEPSKAHEGSIVLTFEEDEDNLPTPESFGFPEDPNAV
jgi:hypothetical protein